MVVCTGFVTYTKKSSHSDMYRMSLKHCFKYNKMGGKKDYMRQTMSSLLKIHSQYEFLGLGLIMIFLVKENKFFSIIVSLFAKGVVTWWHI